jgi:hypothetical protein
MRSKLAGLAAAAVVAGLAASAPASAQTGPDPSEQLTPAETAALDQDVAKEDWADLGQRLDRLRDPAHLAGLANWAHERLTKGANVLVDMQYVNTLWLQAAAAPRGAQQDALASKALVYALYTLEVTTIDGARCHDPTAVSHRLEQFTTMWTPILRHSRALPADQQARIKAEAIALETSIAPLRSNDPVLCADGAEQMQAGIAAGATKEVPTSPGGVGRTYEVERPPGFKTQYLPADQWQPEADRRRTTMPAAIDGIFKLPAK